MRIFGSHVFFWGAYILGGDVFWGVYIFGSSVFWGVYFWGVYIFGSCVFLGGVYFWGDAFFCILIVVVLTGACHPLYLNCAHFVLGLLCLNKVDLKVHKPGNHLAFRERNWGAGGEAWYILHSISFFTSFAFLSLFCF